MAALFDFLLAARERLVPRWATQLVTESAGGLAEDRATALAGAGYDGLLYSLTDVTGGADRGYLEGVISPQLRRGNAIAECAALAERLDAPVCNNYQHNDSFPGSHPLAVGPLGYNGSRAAMELISKADVVLALGTIAHQSALKALGAKLPKHPFAHAAVHRLHMGVTHVDSYHCSRYNTNTGRLTATMFEAAFARATEAHL